MRTLALVLILLAAPLVGCIGSETTEEIEPQTTPEPPSALDRWELYLSQIPGAEELPEPPNVTAPGFDDDRAVVAVVDTGVNPFHERFSRPDQLEPGTTPVRAVDATTGEAARYVPIPQVQAVDEGAWLADVLEPETLYRFAGTNLLWISMMDEVEGIDYGSHGTATAGTVTHEAPDATVVMVQAGGGTLDEAIAWAGAQPWIDVISVSWGCAANCVPFAPFMHTDVPVGVGGDEIPAATRAAHDAGKLVVFSAGNDPTVHVTDPLDGPPWVVAVGGADPYRQGEAWIASKAPDVLANFTVMAPVADGTSGTRPASGTSFAAPSVSGTLASAITQLRRATGHTGGIADGALVATNATTITNSDLRDALNRTAVYWGAMDYDPTGMNPDDPLGTGVPVNPAAPWAQMGWGYVNAGNVDAMVSGLLDGELPTKSAEAIAYRDAVQTSREAQWRGS